MAYETLLGLLGAQPTQDDTLDPQTQALLDTIYRQPAQPTRPANPTPFRQQSGGDKAQSVIAALADVARLVQNTHLQAGEGPRPMGFSAQLAGERDALAREEAARQDFANQGADRAERGRAGYELNRREQAAQEERALARANARRTLDAQDEEAKNLRELKEKSHGIVSEYAHEMLEDLLDAKDAKQVLTITGAAYHARELKRQEEQARSEASRAKEPKEARPPNETDQRNYTDNLKKLDEVASGLPAMLAEKAITPAQVRAEFRVKMDRLDGVMHPDLIARYKAEYERVIEPILAEAETQATAEAKAREQAARTAGEQGRTRSRVNAQSRGSIPQRPPQN